MQYPYNWKLSEANFTKDKGKVFSCFACGGGSTMGYKLAGFDVIGCNEIDPKMMEAYKANHNPKYAFLEPIQTFKNRTDLPSELYELDILDGSPPCSSFSMAGNRDKDWGKEKKFREGQSEQVLDTLFFDFIELAEKLQPKIVIAENVKGLLMGKAKEYVKKIYEDFDKAGYYVQHFLLDASTMGVPQKRERVFFIALRKDLATPFLYTKDMFTIVPRLNLDFNEPEIKYKEIECKYATEGEYKLMPSVEKYYDQVKIGESFSTVHPRKNMFNFFKADPERVLPTLLSNEKARDGVFHYSTKRSLTKKERLLAGSFPLDYNTQNKMACYIVGMSVPPLMTANIASEIYNQWESIFLPIHQNKF